MNTHEYYIAILYAPSTKLFVGTLCWAFRKWVQHIIKPTRR